MESTEDRLLLASQVKIMFVSIFFDLVDAVGKGYAFTCKSGSDSVAKLGENAFFTFPLLMISSMLLAKDVGDW